MIAAHHISTIPIPSVIRSRQRNLYTDIQPVTHSIESIGYTRRPTTPKNPPSLHYRQSLQPRILATRPNGPRTLVPSTSLAAAAVTVPFKSHTAPGDRRDTLARSLTTSLCRSRSPDFSPGVEIPSHNKRPPSSGISRRRRSRGNTGPASWRASLRSTPRWPYT